MPKPSRKRPNSDKHIGLSDSSDENSAEDNQELSSSDDETDNGVDETSQESSEEGIESSDQDDGSSWKDRCIQKWSLTIPENDSTSENSWKEYYEDRDQYKYREQCSGGDYSDCGGDDSDEEDEYWDARGQWGDDMYHFGCYLRAGLNSARQSVNELVPGLGDSLYILTRSYQDEGNGPDMPRDIEAVTKLYSPYFSRFVKFDFSYHHRCRAYSVESMSSLDAYLFQEPDESNPRKIKVFSCHYNNKRHKQIRSKLGLPNLKAIQTHLFGSVPNFKKVSAAKKKNSKSKSKRSKQEKISNPHPPCKGELLLPRYMFKLILAASLFENECQETNASSILHWVARDGNKAFYADSENEEESDTNSNESYYSEKEDEYYSDEDNEYDSDGFGFRRSRSRDECCIS